LRTSWPPLCGFTFSYPGMIFSENGSRWLSGHALKP
jgi:hypothetical protein